MIGGAGCAYASDALSARPSRSFCDDACALSWITIIWSMNAAACLTLAAVHALVWVRRRTEWTSLLFSVTALATAVMVANELWMMRATTVDAFMNSTRWLHLPALGMVVGTIGFVILHMRAGRLWLAWTTIALRFVALALNFLITPSLRFREITQLRTVEFLGEPIVVADGVRNPWMLLGQLGLVLWVVFVVDASISVWRRGDRRLAAVVGVPIVAFCLLSVGQTLVALWGFVDTPVTPSLFFMGVVAALGFELSRKVIDAARFSEELRETHRDMQLAAVAADMALWTWDIARDRIWSTAEGRRIYGIGVEEQVTLARFLATVHQEDRARVQAALDRTCRGDGDFAEDYRIVPSADAIRWISARGRVEVDAKGRVTHLRGVSLDVTERKRAGQQAEVYRNEVAHLSRVTTLGEISGSLAHELNQPLGAILANTEAAELHLQRERPDLAEVRKILADIRTDDLRAGEIIHGMRDFLRRREFEKRPVDVAQLATEAIRLVAGDAAARKVTIGCTIPGDLPHVLGDQVHLLQVLVNLLVNAMDAVATCPLPDRHVVIAARRLETPCIEIAVTDLGVGISPAHLARVFEPFHTTKPGGLGLGLPICRTIIEGLGGTIAIENNPDRGTTARFTLSICDAKSS
jgi:signal transduction histidine kinase